MVSLTFSIIIPPFERPLMIRNCLASIARLHYPKHLFEVIVVNDGGAQISEEFFSDLALEIDLTILNAHHSGPAGARNHGARRAKYEFLAFTDDDCEPDVEWLADYARQFSATPRHLLGGQTINGLTANIYSETTQVLIDYLYRFSQHAGADFAFFTSNNFALPREGFFSIGGFDERFQTGEDRDFCSRWREDSGTSLLLDGATVRHFHTLDLKGLWRQHVNYGRGSSRFRQQRARRAGRPDQLAPIGFYLRMFFYPFRERPWPRACAISFLLFFAQFANAVGFFTQNIARRRAAINLT